MAEGNGRQFSPDVTEIGDKIAALTITKAVELRDYLKEKYKIEPAAGGAVMMAPAAAAAAGAKYEVRRAKDESGATHGPVAGFVLCPSPVAPGVRRSGGPAGRCPDVPPRGPAGNPVVLTAEPGVTPSSRPAYPRLAR